MKKITKSIALALLMILITVTTVVYADYIFPSTNEANKTGTNPVRSGIGPHVNLVEAKVGEVILEFVMPYDYYACFEYRSDGEPSQYGNIYPHPVVTGDYWYYYFCIKNEIVQKTFQADEYVEIRLAVGAERDWDFDWTKFDVLAEPTPPEPTEIDQCKKGGWMSYFRSDASAFKNQGDCIQYVLTGK